MKQIHKKEKDFISAIKNGHEAGYKYLFKTYYNQLCIYVRKMGGKPSIAEDIVQEVFINIWLKRDSLNIQNSLKSYLYKSVHNGYLQYLRKEKITFTSLDQLKWSVLINENLVEDDPDILNNKLNKLQLAIEKLPPKCKMAFKLSRFENLRYKDIAIIMKISQKTVEIHISKALTILRKVQMFFICLLTLTIT